MLRDSKRSQDQEEPTPLDPVVAAREAGLRYVTDRAPGYRRQRRGRGFVYLEKDGKRLGDPDVLRRIRALAVPPAYRDVWICADPNGHLQAVGRDARMRKQYRYHARWRGVRDEAKYGKLLTLARVLPRIRRRVTRDLTRHGLPREKVLAAIVRLLEQTGARIGNAEYARANHSFGLTTLRQRHVRVNGEQLVFDFRAKHGINSHIDFEDRRLARIVRRCQELPGQELFKYFGEDGSPHAVGSEDVNAYLRETSGEDITAKDFRTWSATNLAAAALAGFEAAASAAQARRNVVAAIKSVAEALGNTPAICRKCYIHPAVIESYTAGELAAALRSASGRVASRGLTAEERAVARFLHRHAKREVD